MLACSSLFIVVDKGVALKYVNLFLNEMERKQLLNSAKILQNIFKRVDI